MKQLNLNWLTAAALLFFICGGSIALSSASIVGIFAGLALWAIARSLSKTERGKKGLKTLYKTALKIERATLRQSH